MKNALKPLFWYTCAIMTTYQHIFKILDNFEIVSIGALFGPETAVVNDVISCLVPRDELTTGL